MMRPIIGLTMHPAQKKMEINNGYIQSVELAGGIPICLPAISEQNVEILLSKLDGLLVIGGDDIDPFLFGEEPHAKLGEVVSSRDVSDLLVTKKAFERQLPILAVCRGHQVLNVVFGGTIIQDIPSQVEGALMHKQLSARAEVMHSVISLSPRLQDIFGGETIRVNSFHHQSIGKLGEGLVASGVAKDGIIEAVEHPEHPYCIGVQWHPEELAPMGNMAAQRLFKSFIDASTT